MIDSENKRRSAIGFVLPFQLVSPRADGDISGAADRQHLARVYRGILTFSELQLSGSVGNRLYTQDESISPISLADFFTGGAPTGYSLQAGTLPAGITLDGTTGVVSGTPTAVETQAGIVFRATDGASNADTDTIQMQVIAASGFDRHVLVRSIVSSPFVHPITDDFN